MMSSTKFTIIYFLLLFSTSSYSKNFNTTEKGLKIFFSKADLFQLSDALTENIKENPVRGNITEAISFNSGGNQVTIDGVSYRVNFSEIRIVPEDGHIRSFVSIDTIDVIISTLRVRHYWTSECSNIVISNNDQEVTGRFDSFVSIDDGNLHLTPKQTMLSLTTNPLVISPPRSCKNVLGAPWAVKAIFPSLAQSFLPELSRAIEVFTNDFIEKKVKSFSEDFLNLKISLPLRYRTLKPLYYTVEAKPNSASVSPKGVEYYSDLNLKILAEDSELQKLERENNPEPILRDLSSMSYIGIHKDFFTAILEELNEEKVFELDINGELIPKIKELLHSGFVNKLVPGLNLDNISDNDSISWKILSPSKVNSDFNQREEYFGVLAKMENVGLELSINDQPQMIINLNLDVQFMSRVHPAQRKLQLGIVGFRDIKAHAMDLSSGNILEVSSSELTLLLRTILNGLSPRSALDMDIYDFDIGSKHIGLGGIRQRDDYLSFDGYIADR